jgi:hypothetical protein
MAVGAWDSPEQRGYFLLVIALVTGFWLLLAADWILRLWMKYKNRRLFEKDNLHYFSMEGYGLEHPSASGLIKWSFYRSITEHKKYFRLVGVDHTEHIIPKSVLDGQKIDRAREIFLKAPVSDKNLRP